jgi:hypothetical protein
MYRQVRTKILFSLLLFPFLLHAKGYEKGRLYVFFGAGMGLGDNKGTLEKGLENYTAPGFVNLSSGGQIGFISTFIARDQLAEESKLSSQTKDIGFEYALFRYLGLGLSYSDQLITNNRFPSFPYSAAVAFGLGGEYNATQPFYNLDLASYAYILSRKPANVFQSRTFDFGLFFHFLPDSVWDPYIKLFYGVGTERIFGGTTNRVGANLGLRYHFNQKFFVSTELEHANVFIVNYESGNSGYRHRGNYEESALRFGVGMSFLSPSGTQAESIDSDSPQAKIEEKADLAKKTPVVVEQFSFLASEIFELPSNRIHMEGKAKIDAIARKLQKEFIECEVLIITYTTPYKVDVEGVFENYELGFERSQLISLVLKEKGIASKRIIDSTQGSTRYSVDPNERIVFELRQRKD